MPLEITQRETNGIYLLGLKGRLCSEKRAGGLLTVSDNLLASGATRRSLSGASHLCGQRGPGHTHRNTSKDKSQGGSLKPFVICGRI